MSKLAHVAIDEENRTLDGAAAAIFRMALPLGILLLGIGAIWGLVMRPDPARFFHAWLVDYAFFLSLSLGAIFFVILHHLVRAGWSVVVRRFAEAVAMNLPALIVLAIPVLLGARSLYGWAESHAAQAAHAGAAAAQAGAAQTGEAAHHALSPSKQAWLSPAFFSVRIVLYLAIWSGLAYWFHRLSTEQDRTGNWNLTVRMERASGPAMVLFGLALNFAAFDLLMSLDPHWYSTMFGVYYFSGSALGFFALLPIVTALVQRSGRLTRAITPEHYHDMGKLVFAFTIFWAYIAFSQYMLIWYGNIPEETVWYLRRQTGGWDAIGLLLIFGHFVVPFLALLPRFVKRRSELLVVPAAWMLAMHWIDLHWIVMPELSGAGPAPTLLEAILFLGMAGVLAGLTARRLGSRSLVPEQDPRLTESLQSESV
ncbi:MAG: quinol:cytochrome C oxidoreductase [Candidatus Eisenbacteria bacterium]|nr:quinol:cytochrome C oxidoreductase [Candidatus Eisenbacteria bacterium]